MKESAPATRLKPTDVLALTCTRAGTCCHGKAVWLHPYEVARLARGRGMTPRAFADQHTDGGIRLRFDGPPGYRGLPACSQYDPNAGCRAHDDRPLACRLYPLGRERQGAEIRYVHDGARLPCHEGCPDVAALPHLTVADYLAGQDVPAWTVIQEAYLEMTQDLGEAAFVLALETGLPTPVLGALWQRWAAVAELDHVARAAVIPGDLGTALILPDLDPADPESFVAAHRERMQEALQAFANDAVSDQSPGRDGIIAAASATAFALALHLGQAVGAAPAALSRHWLETARNAAFDRAAEGRRIPMSDDPYQPPAVPVAPPPPPGQLAPGQERLLIALLTAVNFTQMMDFVVMMPLGPQLMDVFAIDAQQFSVAVSAYTYSAAFSALIGSLVIDRFERKKALLVLYAGFAVATLGCALAPDFHTLVIARIAAGACGGLLGALVLAIVGDVIPYARRGAAMGKVMSAFAMASVLGVPMGIWLASWLGWHAAFVAIAVIASVVLAIAVFTLPTLRGHLAGPGRSPAAVFVALLRQPAHWLALAFSAVLCMAGFLIIPFLATYLSRNLGVSDNHLALVYLCGGLCGVVTQPWIGRLADRHGKHRVFIIAALLALIPTLVLTHLQGPLPLAVVLVVTTCFIILGSGRFVPASALISAAVAPSLRGSFMSLNSAVQSGASGLAANLGGFIIVQATPKSPLEHYGYVGWLACIATVIAVGLVGTLRAQGTAPAPAPMPEGV